MGADIKSLRLRMRSVDSTLHLTRAMGLVASSKIRRANEAMRFGREYATAVEQVISSLTASPACAQSPYMRPPEEGGRTRLIVIAGDRGLCGGYNAAFAVPFPMPKSSPSESAHMNATAGFSAPPSISRGKKEICWRVPCAISLSRGNMTVSAFSARSTGR